VSKHAGSGQVSLELDLLRRYVLRIDVVGPGRNSMGWGSGFVVDGARGLAVTCHHVLEHVDDQGGILGPDDVEVSVTPWGQVTPWAARYVEEYSDPGRDIAVLEIEQQPKNLAALRQVSKTQLGPELPDLGEAVLALGYPSPEALPHGTHVSGEADQHAILAPIVFPVAVDPSANRELFCMVFAPERRGDWVAEGMSGAPVLRMSNRRICGMVVGREPVDNNPHGFAIPVRHVLESCQALLTDLAASDPGSSKGPAVSGRAPAPSLTLSALADQLPRRDFEIAGQIRAASRQSVPRGNQMLTGLVRSMLQDRALQRRIRQPETLLLQELHLRLDPGRYDEELLKALETIDRHGRGNAPRPEDVQKALLYALQAILLGARG
jgi:hypothetical protein